MIEMCSFFTTCVYVCMYGMVKFDTISKRFCTLPECIEGIQWNDLHKSNGTSLMKMNLLFTTHTIYKLLSNLIYLIHIFRNAKQQQCTFQEWK